MISRSIRTNLIKGAAIVTATAIAAMTPANAVTTLSSSSTGLVVNLQVGSLAGVGIGPMAQASGTAGPAYSVTQTAAAANQSLSLGSGVSQTLGTGIITDTASSTFPASPFATATSNVASLNLGLGSILSSLLGFNTGALTSTTTYNNGVFTGTSSVANITGLTALLNGIGANAGVGAAPNTFLISNLAGLSVVVNEQIAASSTVGNVLTQSLTTNALHISYKDFAFSGGLLNGDIIVAQSQASAVTAVPEPASWAMMVAGFGALGTALRRRRQQPAAFRVA